MDFSNVIQRHLAVEDSLDALEQQELKVTGNRGLGHAMVVDSGAFSNFIIMDSDSESDDDTEEEFPMDDVLMIPQGFKNPLPQEYEAAPSGHSKMVLPSFTNICFVLEDEAPVKSCIKRVQDLDVSDYTEKESLNLDDAEIEPDLYEQQQFNQYAMADEKVKPEAYNTKLSYSSVNTVDSTPEQIDRAKLDVDQKKLNKSVLGDGPAPVRRTHTANDLLF